MIFVQSSKSAIAFTSENILELFGTITHTSKDTADIIDYDKLVDVAVALQNFISQF